MKRKSETWKYIQRNKDLSLLEVGKRNLQDLFGGFKKDEGNDK